MPVVMTPTLATMGEIYQLSPRGGVNSERFRRYVAENRAGVPLAAYNPMTSSPEALGTVERLLELEAEHIVAIELSRFADLDGQSVHVAVLTPGAWTDRLFTEVRYRAGGFDGVWVWAGSDASVGAITELAIQQVVRMMWQDRFGHDDVLRSVAAQEAVARAAAGVSGSASDSEHLMTREVLEVLGSETDDATLICIPVRRSGGFGGRLAADRSHRRCWPARGHRPPLVGHHVAACPRNRLGAMGRIFWLTLDVRRYRVSRWAVCSRHHRQNFLSSSRSRVLVLFLVVT